MDCLLRGDFYGGRVFMYYLGGGVGVGRFIVVCY